MSRGFFRRSRRRCFITLETTAIGNESSCWKVSSHVARTSHFASVVEKNIEAMEKHRKESEEGRTLQDRIADWITYFSGSMLFVYFHVVWFAVWILLNVGFDG